MNEYEKIKNANRLSATTQDLLHLMKKFGKKTLEKWGYGALSWWSATKNRKDTCGLFQLYFYVNLFNPVENSQIITDKCLMKKSIGKLLNGIFTNEKNENKSRIKAFIDENEIRMGE